jgi:hypothetical protein
MVELRRAALNGPHTGHKIKHGLCELRIESAVLEQHIEALRDGEHGVQAQARALQVRAPPLLPIDQHHHVAHLQDGKANQKYSDHNHETKLGFRWR